MNKIIAVAICFLLFTFVLSVKSEIPRDTLINEVRKNPYVFSINNTFYKVKHLNDDYLLVNDSTKHIIEKFNLSNYNYSTNPSKLYSYYSRGYHSKVWEINLNEKNIKQIYSKQDIEIITIHDHIMYYTKNLVGCNRLFYVNLVEKELKEKEYVPKTIDNYCIINLIGFLNEENMILNTGFMEDAAFILDSKYYLVNFNKKTTKDYKPQIKLNEVFGKHGVYVHYYDLNNKYAFIDTVIIDNKFSYYSSSLSLVGLYFKGFSINYNQVTSLFVSSVTDKKDRWGSQRGGIIMYNPDPFKEKLMYEIYNNILISAEELKRFDAFDLNLLQQMLYAKHNIKFEKEFLQAYFNLYSFYRGAERPRKANTDVLLTDIDKQNLKLIQKAKKAIQ